MSKKLPADERRQALLEVAERLFATRPYDQISVQEIASEAGVARGLIHHYFGGKDDVMAAVIREMLPESAPRTLSTDQPLRARVENRIESLMASIEDHREGWLATLALGPNLDGTLGEVAEELWESQFRVWQSSFADMIELNDRTRSLYAAYRGLNQATCRLWLGGQLSREDARLILVTAQTALLKEVGPAFS